jgi:ankyrin repeat protein
MVHLSGRARESRSIRRLAAGGKGVVLEQRSPRTIGIVSDRPDAVKLLLERSADVNAQSGAGWTALTFAAWRGDDALVRVLLSHGAKPNLVDKQGWTPLDYATAKDTASDAGER